MLFSDLAAAWQAFLAERPALKAQYEAWLPLHLDVPPRMRTRREYFIKTVGLSDADRDAWLSLAIQNPSGPAPAVSWSASDAWRSAVRGVGLADPGTPQKRDVTEVPEERAA
jgi:hypothetical protein